MSFKLHKPIPHSIFTWFLVLQEAQTHTTLDFYAVFCPSRGTNPYHTRFLRCFRSFKKAQTHTTLDFDVVFGPSRGTNPYHTRFLRGCRSSKGNKLTSNLCFYVLFDTPRRFMTTVAWSSVILLVFSAFLASFCGRCARTPFFSPFLQ